MANCTRDDNVEFFSGHWMSRKPDEAERDLIKERVCLECRVGRAEEGPLQISMRRPVEWWMLIVNSSKQEAVCFVTKHLFVSTDLRYIYFYFLTADWKITIRSRTRKKGPLTPFCRCNLVGWVVVSIWVLFLISETKCSTYILVLIPGPFGPLWMCYALSTCQPLQKKPCNVT